MKKLLTIFFFLFSGWCVGQNDREWATYYGGEGNEGFWSPPRVATDHYGNVYMGGMTMSENGIAFHGFQNSYGGGGDMYLVKFDSLGNRLWSTYYGGPNTQQGNDIAVDLLGNIYLAGRTANDSGLSFGGFQNSFGGGNIGGDAFLVKFDSNGNRLWATYYGGSADDIGTSVITDKQGAVYLSGVTKSTSGIASGGFQNSHNGGSQDAFLVKFDSDGDHLWSTYYGGDGFEAGLDIAVDSSDNVYLTGFTGSENNIASGGFQNNFSDSIESFLVKFNPLGIRLWATYYGSSGHDKGTSIATDATGNVYMAGSTTSTSNMAMDGFQNNYGGGEADDFLVKFSADGDRLWATYYGGNGKEEVPVVTTDINGDVYLAGDTYSSNGIAYAGFQNNLIGIENQFLVKFDSTGSRICATYYGQSHEEDPSLAVDRFGGVYVSASTNSTSGIASNGFQNTSGGDLDAYLVKFTLRGNVSIDLNEFSRTINIYPNPTSGNLIVHSALILKDTEILVFNELGQQVFAPYISKKENTVVKYVGHLSSGNYYLHLQSAEGVAVKKFEVIR